MTYKWKTINFYSDLENEALKQSLFKHVKIKEPLLQCLINRNIKTKEEVEHFFNPELKDLFDPFLLKDMKKAVKRIEKALGDKEKILIYGDYDVDGTTSVALTYSFLRRFTSNIDYYIPDRNGEGYGISYQGIDYAIENDVTLIIVLDCGIKALDQVCYAKSKGIDFIICDHHVTGEHLPDAKAVVNPKRKDCPYPDKNLSACGVGFKLVQAFAKSNSIPFKEIRNLLDLVAVSIAADIVPMIGENRILMHYGLERLNTQPSFGLKAILDVCSLRDKQIGTSDIVFKIGPRINASGRMTNGKETVDLLLAKDQTTANNMIRQINMYNKERQKLDKIITREAIDLVEKEVDLKNAKCIFLFKSDWHKGIIGIVASRLTEKYYRPCIILSQSGDIVSGSVRSLMGFDAYKALHQCRDLLESFGGHMYAAGLSLKKENLEKFKERITEISSQEITIKKISPEILFDSELDFSEIDNQFVSQLKLFRPFGPDNENPIFVTRRVHDTGRSKLVGQKFSHIRLDLYQNDVNEVMQAIAFDKRELFHIVKSGKPFDICYTIEENIHGSTKFIQLMVNDIRLSEHETTIT